MPRGCYRGNRRGDADAPCLKRSAGRCVHGHVVRTVQYPAAAHLSISRLLSSPLFSIFCLLFWASSGAVLIHHSAQHMHGVEPADIPPALLARMMLI